MSLEDAIRRARGKDLTGPELHSAIKQLNNISNQLLHGDNMKTFLDVIHFSDKDDILKQYDIDGTTIKLKAIHFKPILQVVKGASMGFPGGANYWVTIKKVNDDNLKVSITKKCDLCDGTGEVNCGDCSGTGDCACPECGAEHECGSCDGSGVVNCDFCQGESFDKDEIIFEENILLNQGELF